MSDQCAIDNTVVKKKKKTDTCFDLDEGFCLFLNTLHSLTNTDKKSQTKHEVD